MIPFVRTNVPQLGLTYESTNNLWGRTINPWNKERSSGGSSGGEAALISLRGSPIGIGSDIGGSIRIPANFCGVFGLKTYSKRISCTYHTFNFFYVVKFQGLFLEAVCHFVWALLEDHLRIWHYG